MNLEGTETFNPSQVVKRGREIDGEPEDRIDSVEVKIYFYFSFLRPSGHKEMVLPTTPTPPLSPPVPDWPTLPKALGTVTELLMSPKPQSHCCFAINFSDTDFEYDFQTFRAGVSSLLVVSHLSGRPRWRTFERPSLLLRPQVSYSASQGSCPGPLTFSLSAHNWADVKGNLNFQIRAA